MEVNAEMSYDENVRIEVVNRKKKFVNFDNSVKSMDKDSRSKMMNYLVNTFFVLKKLINEDPESNFDRLYNSAMESINTNCFQEEQGNLLYLFKNLSEEDFKLTPTINREYRKHAIVMTSDIIMEKLIRGEEIVGIIPAKLINGLDACGIKYTNTTPMIKMNDPSFSYSSYNEIEERIKNYLVSEIEYYEKNKEEIITQLDEKYFDSMLLFITEQIKSLCFYSIPGLDANKYLGFMQETLFHREDNEEYSGIIEQRDNIDQDYVGGGIDGYRDETTL